MDNRLMTIYMLEKRYKDIDNRWTSDVIDWEGYFTSEEACQARIEVLEKWDKRYAKYISGISVRNRTSQESYNMLKDKWDRLSSMVDNPEDFMEQPVAPGAEEPLDSGQWKALQEPEYSYTDIDRSDFDADV